jgi:hypothetical protein
MFRKFILFIACAIALNSFAQTTRLEKSIDDLSNRLVSSQEVAGVNVLLVRDGKILYNKALDYADVATKQPLRLTGEALSTETNDSARRKTSKLHFRPPDAKPLVACSCIFSFFSLVLLLLYFSDIERII